ncbi:MAG: hypothetical protein ABJB10_01300 [Mesorhizobium sp.]
MKFMIIPPDFVLDRPSCDRRKNGSLVRRFRGFPQSQKNIAVYEPGRKNHSEKSHSEIVMGGKAGAPEPREVAGKAEPITI